MSLRLLFSSWRLCVKDFVSRKDAKESKERKEKRPAKPLGYF